MNGLLTNTKDVTKETSPKVGFADFCHHLLATTSAHMHANHCVLLEC